MSAKILVGNLPAGTTADEVRDELDTMGAPILGIELSEGGDPDNLTFVVELQIDPATARIIADRRRDRMFKGRRITVYAPRLMT